MRHQLYIARQCNKGFVRAGFTLVEILVALAVFMLLLVIVLVPLNLAVDLLHIGKTEVSLRGTTQTIVDRMQSDLTHAVYVFPNDVLPSVTGTPDAPEAPYGGDTSVLPLPVSVNPYFNGVPCDDLRVSNLARIDMLLPNTNNHDSIFTPLTPIYYLVTYYARRLDISKQYQPLDNPIVLFRAQIPFRGDPVCDACMVDPDGNAVQPATTGEIYPSGSTLNVNIFDGRYTHLSDCTTDGAAINRSAEWLTQSEFGEPDLEPLTRGTSEVFTLYGAHTDMLQEGMGLNTRASYRQAPSNYERPDNSFICADTNNDGIIDQVTMKLSVYKIDDTKAYSAHQFALSQVVNLPNVRHIDSVR